MTDLEQPKKVAPPSLLAEFWAFLKVRKKWWLAPLIAILLLLSLLIVLSEGSAVAPFVYTVF